jgi:hypothetical protein
MKLFCIFLSICIAFTNNTSIIGEGAQPRISRDTKGIIRVAYGQHDKIFCTTTTNNGNTFSTPMLVADLPGMHLGMSRGPQIASSANYSIITAMDKSGDIYWYRLNKSTKEWEKMGTVNDLKGSAPEGLMGIAADNNDNFYAVWLDLRKGKKNQVYFSTLSGSSRQWSPNKLIYESPDGHVCECCKPNVYAEGQNIVVMFRNWLGGSRDLYLLKSSNKGASFEKAQKLGEDTWALNACPMDGGGVAIDKSGNIYTVWRRKSTVYYCKPGEKEIKIGEGKTCSIALSPEPLISMQTGDTLQLIRPGHEVQMVVGTGSFLQSMPVPGNGTLCVWEQGGVVKYRKM